MPIRKKKISDLTLADSLKGLYTIGYKVVGGVKTSVKVGLEYIQVAYEDVVKATQDAISAAKTALTAASTADTSRETIEANELKRESNESARKTSEQERAAAENQRATAETGRDNAEKARVTEFSKIKTDAEKATSDAISATGKTNEATQNANVATNAANAATAAANQAAIEANKSAENAEGKAQAAQVAADNANDTAEHPTYIGQDHYVYKWNKTTSSYDKTDIYTKGDAFSIKKVYASVAELEADADNAGIAEGDFVLVNTGDVENPDNAKLYVKAKSDAGVYSYEFLVDMSGAIGFTGKTPQFSMGTISTLEAGSSATATVSEDGVDSDGNPKYKINFAIPRGNPGAPFNPVGQYDTLELLQAAIPDGSGVNGMIAVGTEAPYEYYAWLNGGWVNQGKVAGGGSGNVVAIPFDVVNLSNQSSSAEIFNAFGGKDAFMDICKKIFSDDVVCVISIVDGTDKIAYTSSVANASYIDENNALLVLEISDGGYMIINTTVNVTNGLATVDIQTINLVKEAPSDGNTYGRKNQDWVEVPEKSDVLTKTNTTEYTPTGDYQPATKKYVDDNIIYKKIDFSGGNYDTRGVILLWKKSIYDTSYYRYKGIINGNFINTKQQAYTPDGMVNIYLNASVNYFNEEGIIGGQNDIYAKGNSTIYSLRLITCTYNSEDYVALLVGINGFFDTFVGYFSENTLFKWIDVNVLYDGYIYNKEIYDSIKDLDTVHIISTDDKLKTMFADITQSPEQDLNNINGFGIMSNSVDHFATPERNYPLQQAGTLFYGKAAYGSSNQIYGSFSSNRWFARGGGSGPTKKTSWREFAFKDDIYKSTVSSGSIDNITTAGEYVISPDVTDAPFTSWCWLKIMGGSDIVQIVINMLDLRIAIRGRVNGNWRSWKLITPVDI